MAMRYMNLTRREMLGGLSALGVSIGLQNACWSSEVQSALDSISTQKRLIVLWMAGGPSQLDTFDLKPGHPNGGEFKEIQTSVPGIRISEHLPSVAKLMNHLAIVRSLGTKEGDHSRGTYLVRTGQRPGSPLPYPSLTSALAKELSPGDAMIPDLVNVLPATAINPMAFGSGFLGPQHEPLTVGLANEPGTAASDERMTNLKVDNLRPARELGIERIDRRRELWSMLQDSFDVPNRGDAPRAHSTMHSRGMQLSDSDLASAFDLDQESDKTRHKYGKSSFGQGCLMARRLVERGVPVVEVSLGASEIGWDTHTDNFSRIKQLSAQLDLGWSQLMNDLIDRDLLSSTTILWIGEFGRTPQINEMGGRDHFPNAYSCVLGGGNIAGGQVYGQTNESGMEIADSPVVIEDLLATVAQSVGVSPEQENYAGDRPIKISEGTAIEKLLA